MKIYSVYQKIVLSVALLSVLGVLFLLPACEPPVTVNRLEGIAKGCCDCTNQLMQLNQQAAKTPAEADFKAMEAEYKKTKECLTNVTNSLGKVKVEELGELEKQLQPRCPALAAQHELLRELLVE